MPKLSPFLALRISRFRNYIFGAFASEIGNQMQTVTVAWQVYELTKNPAALGLIGLANIMPIIIFSLIGGLAADKLNRKKLLLISQSTMAILAFSLFTLTSLHLINPWIIYLILFLHSTASSFSLPARHSILPHLVPKKYFLNAVSLHTLQFQSATLIGPAVAGFLIAGFGTQSVYLFNAISFLFFIAAVISFKIPLHPQKMQVEFNLRSVKEGVSFVFSTPILYTTMMLDFLATFFGTATILMPIFAQDILHVGPQGLGLLYSAPAIGAVLGGLLLSTISRIENQGKVIISAVILYGVATIGFGLSKEFFVSLAFLVLVGFGDMISMVLRNTIRQIITPDHLRGRMASFMRIFFQGGPQLGEVEAGFLAKVIGGPATVVIGGLGVILITSLIAWKSKSLREYKGKELEV